MSARSDFLYSQFLAHLPFAPTPCQDGLFKSLAEFCCGDETLMVVSGFAGTGKTTALSSVIRTLADNRISKVLLAPTGRAAKVLSTYSSFPAYTIHKYIYRQKGVGDNGMGSFSISPNKDKNTLYIVDEASLIGLDGQSSFGSGDLLDDLILFVESGRDCKLVLVGDSAQLPPVGMAISPAMEETNMRMRGASRFCTLTTVVRQQSDSAILSDATRIRNLVEKQAPCTISDLGLIAGKDMDVSLVRGGELIEILGDAYSRYGEQQTIVVCRSNKRALRYNAGIRGSVQYKEERLVRGDKLMVVKNCYNFTEDLDGLDFIANGESVNLVRIRNFENRYGFEFASATLSLPDYGDQEFTATVLLDTLSSESPSLTYEQSNSLYTQVNEDYSHIKGKKKRWEAVRSDRYFSALQLKYGDAVTAHKSQGGQWDCVFVDWPFWQDELSTEDLRWLYTAMTRATKKLYLVNFPQKAFGNS